MSDEVSPVRYELRTQLHKAQAQLEQARSQGDADMAAAAQGRILDLRELAERGDVIDLEDVAS